jgi:hypothetical protein
LTQELLKQETSLLASLAQWESEASRYRLALDKAEQEIVAIKTDLNDVREKLLRPFLDGLLIPLSMSYTLKVHPTTGELLLSIIPLSGGELEFDKFVSGIRWEDTDNIPLFHVLNYFGAGMPWGSQTPNQYV